MILILLLCIILYVIGRVTKDYTITILSGLAICTVGVYIAISPIDGTTNFLRLILFSVLFGLGGYVWVTASLELLHKYKV